MANITPVKAIRSGADVIALGEFVAGDTLDPVLMPALGTPLSGTLNNCTTNTEAAGTNNTQLASTAYVYAERANTATLTNKTLEAASNTGITPFQDSRFASIAATLPAIIIVAHCSHLAKNDTDKGAWRKRKGQSWRSETRTAGKYAGGTGYATAALAVAAGYGLTDYYYNTTAGNFQEITATGTPASTVTYRAGREDYPTNAYITAEASRVIIWDLDGAVPSMWMVFTLTGVTAYWASGSTCSSLAVANNHLLLGASISGIREIDFLHDNCRIGHTTNYGHSAQPVANRNSTTALWGGTDGYVLVSATVNSVAITVLSDAPYENGIPVPTIAVGTAGGTSVINSNGVVRNSAIITSNAGTSFDTEGNLYVMNNVAGSRTYRMYTPTDYAGAAFTETYKIYSSNDAGRVSPINTPSSTLLLPTKEGGVSSGGGSGLTIFKNNQTTVGSGMVAHITSAYNTGYMVGDISRCWLADSLSGTIADMELIANGTFTDASNLSLIGATVSAGTLNFAASSLDSAQFTGGTALEAGKTYALTFTITASTAAYGVRITVGGILYADVYYTVAATYTVNITPQNGGNLAFARASTSHTGTLSIDNVSLKEVSADRSVKAKPLSVVGTLTRTAYAGGRTVYSGFSASNYFQEASHADWNALGTGDFSIIMSGVKWGTSGTDRTCISIGNGVSVGSSYFRITGGNRLALGTYNGATFVNELVTDAGVTFTDTSEHTVEVKRISAVMYIVVDGVVVKSGASTSTISNATGYLRIGESQDASLPWAGGQVSCVRISATAPTAEQSKDIARQENALNGGAACLLSNSSSVTSLTHHSDTGLREVENGTATDFFSGLARVGSVTTTSGITGAVAEGQLPNVALLNSGTTNKFWSAERNVKAELLEAQVVYPKEQQYAFSTGVGITTQALPQGWKARGLLFVVAGANSVPTQTFDSYIRTLTGLTASTSYQINLVEVL